MKRSGTGIVHVGGVGTRLGCQLVGFGIVLYQTLRVEGDSQRRCCAAPDVMRALWV